MALGEETWRRNMSWSDTFNELKTLHDQAYKKIDEALKYDEEGQKDKALASYNQGLMLLDKALSSNIECPSSPDLSWERACCMVDKMRKTRKEILSRIADTQVQPTPVQQPVQLLVQQPVQLPVLQPAPERPEDLALEPPPSYEEAMATSPSSSSASNIPSLPTSSSPRTYGELGEVLQSLKVETNMQSVKVIFLVDDVRMYYISPDGSVSAPSLPTQLRVLELEDGRQEGLPKYFLQVGEWFYPLVPDVSPCFRSDYGAFILPDVQSQVEGAAVGLILPPEADLSLYELLESVLHGVVSQPPAPPPRTRTRRDNFSTTISKGIVTGANYVSSGLMKGAEAASNYVSTTTPKIISKLSPEEPRPVPPTLRTSAKVARSVTHTAVNVTGFVAGKVGSATMALGRYLAPHVQRGGTKLLTKVGVAEDKAAEGVGGVLTVAAGAVEGFGTIYMGLEQSANLLGSSLANNTVKIVQHKYGEPMAEVTGNTLYTVGNVYNTTNNISNLTPKGLAKRTAKDTGKALVETHKFDQNDGKLLLKMEKQLVYPIIPNVTPVLLSERDRFIMLPDLERKGAAIGIHLPEGVLVLVHKILHLPPPPDDVTKFLSRAEAIAAGIVHKAEAVGHVISQKAATIQAGMPAAPATNPWWRKGTHEVRKATEKIVAITAKTNQLVGNAIANVHKAVLRRRRPVINGQPKEEKTVASPEKKDADEPVKYSIRQYSDNMVTATLKAGMSMIASLKKAAKILRTSLRENTVKIVQHKFGEDVKETMGDVIKMVENTMKVTDHIADLQPGNIVNRAISTFAGGTQGSDSPDKAEPRLGMCKEDL